MMASVIAVNQYLDGHRGWAVFWAAAATAIKTTGVVVAGALAVTELLVNKSGLRSGVAVALLVPSAVVAVGRLFLASGGEGYSSVPLALADSAFWFSTNPVALLLLVVAVRGTASFWKDADQTSLISALVVVCFLAAFLVLPILGTRQAFLPRYLVPVIPFAVVAAGSDLRRQLSTRAALVSGVALLVYSVIGYAGLLLPFSDEPNVILQERSNAYREVLLLQDDALDRAIAEGVPVITDLNLWFRNRVPRLGYVDETAPDVYAYAVIPFDPLDVRTYPPQMVILDPGANGTGLHELVSIVEDAPDIELKRETLTRGRFELELLFVSRTDS